jgi:small subunit ribosomal protein S3
VGQKVNPVGFRIGIYRNWNARWFARRPQQYSQLALEDIRIRRYVDENLRGAEVADVEIERTGDSARVIIHSARPGIVIGRKGQDIDVLRKELGAFLGRQNVEVSVQEVKKPELHARVVARDIADQLEKRSSFKKAMKKAAASTLKAGARGIKIRCSGRLAGAEIARDEWLRTGSVPLHTLRSDIDYALVEAHTTYGRIGVKVWICRGEYKLV